MLIKISYISIKLSVVVFFVISVKNLNTIYIKIIIMILPQLNQFEIITNSADNTTLLFHNPLIYYILQKMFYLVSYLIFSSVCRSGLRGPLAYSLLGGGIPSHSIG